MKREYTQKQVAKSACTPVCDIKNGDFAIKDSGTRQEFASGAVRDAEEGKGRYDLLPTRAIRRLARLYEAGAKKYGDDNWLKGIPLRRMLDSAMRHLFKAAEGKTDEDHFIAAVWNILGIVEYQERIKEGILPADLDNLPKLKEIGEGK